MAKRLRVCGGDGGESNSPSRKGRSRSTTSLVDSLISLGWPLSTESSRASQAVLRCLLLTSETQHLDYPSPIPNPPRRSQGGRVTLEGVTLQPLLVRQLFVATRFTRWMAISACNLATPSPCRTHASPYCFVKMLICLYYTPKLCKG